MRREIGWFNSFNVHQKSPLAVGIEFSTLSLDTLFGSAEILADRVRAMTNGNFDIRVYPGGELAGALEVLDSVQQGSVQVGQSASYYYIGKILPSRLNVACHSE